MLRLQERAPGPLLSCVRAQTPVQTTESFCRKEIAGGAEKIIWARPDSEGRTGELACVFRKHSSCTRSHRFNTLHECSLVTEGIREPGLEEVPDPESRAPESRFAFRVSRCGLCRSVQPGGADRP